MGVMARFGFCIPLLFIGSWAFGATDNLLTNGGFEGGAGADGVPVAWRKDFFVGKPSWSMTSDSPHGGAKCALIETVSDVNAFLISDPPLPCAPNEQLSLSVWCRAGDMTTSSGGKLIANLAFIGPEGYLYQRRRATVTVPKAGEWFQIKAEFTAPPRCSAVSLQIGTQQMTGKCWWDDAEIRSAKSLVARFHTPNLKFEPGDQEVPLVVINRDPKLTGVEIVVDANHAKDHTGQVVLSKVSDKPETTVPVKFKFTKRGNTRLQADVSFKEAGSAACITTQTVYIYPELKVDPLLPTHYVIEDGGAPHFEARVFVREASVGEREKLSLKYELRDSANKVAASGTLSKLTPNPITIKAALKEAINTPGDYTFDVKLINGDRVTTNATQDWHIIHRNQAETILGPDGNLIVDGKPFFPLGMYMGRDFKGLNEIGFNVLQWYNMFTWDEGGDQEIKDLLDRIEKAHSKALMFVSHGLHWRMPMEEARRRIQVFRNHPAVLVWYQEEAVARGIWTLPQLGEFYNICKHEDPHHPVLIGDESDMSAKIKDRAKMFPDEYMDIATWWWYPIPPRPTDNPEGYEGERAINDEIVPPSFLTLPKIKKPIWVTLQCYRKPGPTDTRFATEAEYRAMTYIAVIHGSKALMWYTGTGESGGGIQEHLEEGHWDYFKKLIGESKEMGPVFMAPDAKEQATLEPGGAPISMLVKQVGDKRVLLAVNRGVAPVEANIKLPGLAKRAINVRFENRTIQPQDDGGFADKFAQYAVHVYELP